MNFAPGTPFGYVSAALMLAGLIGALIYFLWAITVAFAKLRLALSYTSRARMLYRDRKAMSPDGSSGLLKDTAAEMKRVYFLETLPMKSALVRLFFALIFLIPAYLGFQGLRLDSLVAEMTHVPASGALDIGHWTPEGFTRLDGTLLCSHVPFAYCQVEGETMAFPGFLHSLGLGRYHQLKSLNFFFQKPHSLPAVPDERLDLDSGPLFAYLRTHPGMAKRLDYQTLDSLSMRTTHSGLRLLQDGYQIVSGPSKKTDPENAP